MSDVRQFDVDLTECEHCGWETTDLKPTPTRDERLNVFLCPVCFSTYGSGATIYRREASTNDLVRDVAWCTNRILAEISAEREPAPTYVAEGWWHPHVKSGQVHEHPENPGGGWSEASHRLCEPVYTRRSARSGDEGT